MEVGFVVTWRGMIGALLIGGRSSRMGLDKHRILYAGEPMARRLLNLLVQVTGRTPLVVGGRWPGCEPHVEDVEGVQGPLAGVIAALRAADNDAVLVLAADFPLLNVEALAWLVGHADRPGSVATWPRHRDRPFGEPLCSVYGPESADILSGSAGAGHAALHRALPPRMRHEPPIPAIHEAALSGANTVAEWIELTGERPST